ncbi:hypothetical protein HK097_004422 [Rhizophlyctis rosea]|uniref:Elongation factor P n=1 Tax=Rhizophlyctis rosea TaxID=64517 RepID=A0AAD5SHE5_9FUNG|nr:hypothetical protein HK097_004422 [Rhizophlyctis rosea]
MLRLPSLFTRRPTPTLTRSLLHLSRRNVQVAVNTVKRGTVISYRDKLWLVTFATHHQQGRGGAHYKLDLNELGSNTKKQERFNSGSMIEAVELDEKVAQFLYTSDGQIHVMDKDTFEETSFPVDVLEGSTKVLPYLLDSTPITLSLHESRPIIARSPDRLTYRVTEVTLASTSTSPDSKRTGSKTATLDVGVTVQVPDFINVGDSVVVNILEGKYLSRAK